MDIYTHTNFFFIISFIKSRETYFSFLYTSWIYNFHLSFPLYFLFSMGFSILYVIQYFLLRAAQYRVNLSFCITYSYILGPQDNACFPQHVGCLVNWISFIKALRKRPTLNLSALCLIVKYTQRTASQTQIMSNPRLNFTVSYSSSLLVLALV